MDELLWGLVYRDFPVAGILEVSFIEIWHSNLHFTYTAETIPKFDP